MIRVTGLVELDMAFRKMPEAVSHKVLQQANELSARPLVEAAHLLSPVGETGNLAESIGVEKPSIKRVDQIGMVRVGPRRGGKNKGYHAHLVEYSKTNRDGSKSKAQPFMHNAFERTKAQVLALFELNVGRKIISHMNRFIKRHA